MKKVLWASLLGSSAYATVRYNVLQSVPWSDWPVYTVNKSVAFSALILLFVSSLASCFNPGRSQKPIMKAVGWLVVLHVSLSFALLNPAYFEDFYSSDKLTVLAGVSILVGGISLVLLMDGAGTAASSDGRKWGRLLLLALGSVHN